MSRKHIVRTVGVFGGSIILLLGIYGITFGDSTTLTIDVFDVGQGDAILIRTPYHQSILIDGGGDATVQEKLGRTLPFYDRELDLVLLTHPHADHVNGLPGVLRHYDIRKVLATDIAHENSGYAEFLKTVKEKHIPLEGARAGKIFRLGPDLTLEILTPNEDLSDRHIEDLNDSSIVARLIYRKKSFLFTGDAGRDVEESLLSGHVDLDSDVLKVGHHGSEGATTEHFLDSVTPEVALISVGKKNRYGHPHTALLERLMKHGIKTYRTDQEGDIRIKSDGETIHVQP
ncbi:MAG: ComEC/Rec2 family competence protein [bacterium]|nr:ComEC/Rec2 family competence protein [bacterium]